MNRSDFKSVRDLKLEGFEVVSNLRVASSKEAIVKLNKYGVIVNKPFMKLIGDFKNIEVQINKEQKLALFVGRNKESTKTFKISKAGKIGGTILRNKLVEIVTEDTARCFQIVAEVEKRFPLPNDTSLIIDLKEATQI